MSKITREQASDAFTDIVESLYDDQVTENESLIDIVSTYLNTGPNTCKGCGSETTI